MILQDVLERYPNLHYGGLGKVKDPIAVTEEPWVEFTVQWLQSNFKPNKTANRGGYYSYELKHVMQYLTKYYVSNGAFIAGALIAGFPVGKTEKVGISRESALAFDLKRLEDVPMEKRYGVEYLIEWDIKYHYRWKKLKPDNSITECDPKLDLGKLRKAVGWLKRWDFNGDLRSVNFNIAVVMEIDTNFYPGPDNMVAALDFLGVKHSPDLSKLAVSDKTATKLQKLWEKYNQ